MRDLWDDVLVTHRAAVERLPASIRGDFLPPGPFDAIKACGISIESLEMPRPQFAAGGIIRSTWWAPSIANTAAPTTAEIAAGVRP